MTAGAAGGAADDVRRAATVAEALRAATATIAAAHSQSPRLDAEVLLAEALGVRREDLFAAPERPLARDEAARFEGLVRRRQKQEPVAYIVGRRAFRTIDLHVTDNVLIPRPETETLVEVCLEKLGETDGGEPYVLDIGTGSGAIALALAAEHPTVRVVATDVHPAPLDVARRNARDLGLAGRVTFLVSDVFDDLPPGLRFDLIVSNPPYVTPEALRRLRVEVRGYEPHVALRAEDGGMEFYRRIVPQAPAWLVPGGILAVEIAEHKAVEVLGEFVGAGRYEQIDVRDDLGGLPRVVVARERAEGATPAPAAGD
ncbi:MAG TPA: peptide chain release factor N(5)-glutamine methyltransferase, partial [Thermoleophilia bacterium]|nr:peptide chain release factor N(5)-glutamine methyltransferase [Thermoleophilia bacterium]